MKKQVAIVKFPNTSNFSNSYEKSYNFFTDVEGLQKGDKVIVDTINGLSIAEFVQYNDLGFGETGIKAPTKWLIQKIDIEAHTKRIEAANKIAKLKTMMEAEREKAQELEIYEILAKQNPEIAKLLNEFKTLRKVL